MGRTFLVFTLGAVLGGGLALLTASRSGPDNRQKLHDMADATRGKLNAMTEDAEARLKKVIQDSRDLLDENADLVKAAVKAGKEAVAAEKAKQEKSS
jgi:gas vesicle protein